MTIICCSVHRRFIHEDYLHPCPIRIAAQPNSFYFSRDGMSNCALRFIPPNLCVESRTLSTDPAHCCTRHMHEFSPPSRLTAMGPAVVVTCDSSLLPLLLARGHLGTAALILADHTHTNTRVLVRCGRHDKSQGAAVRLTAAHQARAVPLHHAHTHTGQAYAAPSGSQDGGAMLQSPSAPLPRGHSKLSAALMNRSFWARLPPRAAALAALLYPLMERANTVTCTMQRAYKHTHLCTRARTPMHTQPYAACACAGCSAVDYNGVHPQLQVRPHQCVAIHLCGDLLEAAAAIHVQQS